ncbi:MAG: hypothetical protein SWZ49_10465 [Cyanobacteriota bacterium]|nr:hypothetical protein [Cyanobacteriota bacterium]
MVNRIKYDGFGFDYPRTKLCPYGRARLAERDDSLRPLTVLQVERTRTLLPVFKPGTTVVSIKIQL